MRWGFKMPDRLLFNARSEGINRWSVWRESFEMRRCIVPADSFYEWEKLRKGRKYEFTVPGRELFGMAGIWAPWKNEKTGEAERAFAILTTEANATMLPVHNRPAFWSRVTTRSISTKPSRRCTCCVCWAMKVWR
jgi:putative SOS response-associated peptidase YedK